MDLSLCLTSANAAGPVDNFSPASSQSWSITTASGGISGFNAGSCQLGNSGFANSLAGGVFTLGQLGNSLVLTFNPAGFVPETGTLGAVAMLATLVGCGWVRRRRST